ncbi:sigma-70 family RNA polymerase sigma factor [Evansella tamaricis]|uniref:Sigma-70 family RNA polymerase sigma factor n=1 Tax=Evansella tamaricis TaxID=2069301 RepID=A0ABS6JGJ7_9BACI|nr:sigma-70 family RNA polymerase sigma factor [Evansella tamaricis]MBU9712816.1 sigma-70 family RNA polymerase sigma factor [Evansella tamaricis]
MYEWQETEDSMEMIHDKEERLDQLMTSYSQGILQLVYTYVKNHTTAEDLTQEIFIKCYEKMDQYKGRASLRTWLYRVAINHCKDYLRSWHHRKVTIHDKLFEYLPSKDKQLESLIVEKSRDEILSESVLNLPIKYREIIYLYYFEELTLDEISKTTLVNLNTVKTRLTRAKELLKKSLKEVINDE